jgi:16S rRNA processing protein RimM
MKFIRIGKIVNTHGIKGELRILSDFRHKDKVFIPGMKFYVGKEKKEFIVNSYRFHKIYDMVTFKGFNNINDVEYLKGDFVFINEEDLVLDNGEILSTNLIGYNMKVGNKDAGEIIEIIDTPANEVLKTEITMVPYVKEFIKKIDNEEKIVYINDIGGLI